MFVVADLDLLSTPLVTLIHLPVALIALIIDASSGSVHRRVVWIYCRHIGLAARNLDQTWLAL